eukprot:jgi/Bigna1/83749/fgenesh1_pg.114_\
MSAAVSTTFLLFSLSKSSLVIISGESLENLWRISAAGLIPYLNFFESEGGCTRGGEGRMVTSTMITITALIFSITLDHRHNVEASAIKNSAATTTLQPEENHLAWPSGDDDVSPSFDPIDYVARQFNATMTSFLEMGVTIGSGASVGVGSGSGAGLVRGYCEVCILIMQMKERGMPHLCDGLNTNFYITCVQNIESLLRADKALVYWMKNGCMHLDAEGPEIVRPCPALPICSWVPNLFAQPPSVVRDGIEALCPKDPKFLPKIPEEFAVRATQPTNLPIKPVG